MTEINYNLPVWDLTEIYTDIKDPKIKTDLKKIRDSSDKFVKKWKGRIKDLNPSDFLSCIETYQKICESLHKIGTHSSLIFATNMEDAEISRYNSSVSDEFTEIFSSLIGTFKSTRVRTLLPSNSI